MVGSVKTGSETVGIGFFGVGLVDFGHPVSVTAKSVCFEDPDIDLPLAIEPATDSDLAFAKFGGSVGSEVFHGWFSWKFR